LTGHRLIQYPSCLTSGPGSAAIDASLGATPAGQ
jgi:hypothetical protein